MTRGFEFEDAVTWLTLPLFIAAILTMVMIVREVWPSLSAEDQTRFRRWTWPSGYVRNSAALNKAWSEHYRLFPASRKRVLFTCLLISACLSLLAYPLWLVLTQR
jgi:hypothetical protein